jgi:hypothetical protein
MYQGVARPGSHYAQLMTSTVLVEAKHVDHKINKERSYQKSGEIIAVKFNQFTLPSHRSVTALREVMREREYCH